MGLSRGEVVSGERRLPCLDRRTFLAQSAQAALCAAFVAACGDGVLGVATGPGPENVNLTVTLASVPSLNTIGVPVRLSGTNTPIAVVRATSSTYRAFSMVCPHAGSTINVVGAGFTCPNHGAMFAASGAWIGGEATRNLFEFTVVHDAAAGTLTITS